MSVINVCLSHIFLVSSISIGFECPEDTLGSVTPDPEDCRSYYDCPVDQEPLHETCTKGPPATLFDDTLLICNYEDLVDCGDRPIIDGPATTTTTVETTTTTVETTTTATVTTGKKEQPTVEKR